MNQNINSTTNNLKSNTFWGIIFVLITGTIAHFVYEWSDNSFIIGLFFPVNESTWEHMKLCFFPMLLYSLYMNKKRKKEYPGVTSALLFGILLSTFLIPVFFYTYSGIIGKTFMPLDIVTFIASVLLSFRAVYKLTLSEKLISFTGMLKIFVIIIAVFFLLFSYNPPDISLFVNPER